ncbi:MAG: YybH family protein [Longimicrobiales bacterium]|jgi:ketosteroid isomerase-like protein
MKKRFALFLACALSTPVSAQTGTDAEQIRAVRALSNEAIARHDVPAIVATLDDEVHVTAGAGGFISGPEAMRSAFIRQFEQFDDVLYVRTITSLEIGSAAAVASERGTWVGTWTAPDGPRRAGGRYSAYWRQTDDGWRIRSELFVTLFCEGAGCAP